MSGIVIVGASLAGTQAAQAARRAGYDGPMTIVGREPHYPYDRPPLSKAYLTDDEVDEDRLRLRPAADPDALEVDWRLGRSATGLDGPTRTVHLDDGAEVTGEVVIVATGASPRRLSGIEPDLAGVFELRTLDDARALRTALAGPPVRVLVCGAGFIGAEVAASARERGHEVTLVDVAAAPLDRVLDRAAGLAVADLHRGHGVDVRLATGLVGVEHAGDPARVTAATLSDGTTVPADVVVVGIGVVPEVDWLAEAGLTVDDGLVADDHLTAGPGILVAGDVARWPNARFGGQLMRVEQWDNAV
ncbi:MAG: FAD/NAD(P)-binding oxidoreductase, partial [Actinomycetota bacterium]